MQLADGNSVSEAALGSMSTVRAFDAGESELHEFQTCMQSYLALNIRSAIAYLGYATCVTALPQLVTALVLFYGGLLVRNGDMTSGQLVSFLLYLQSLSDAFGSIGYIFSSLTQAVGAADKVFELMNRNPRLTPPEQNASASSRPASRGIMGIEATRTAGYRYSGISPEGCRGEVTLRGVELFYPARPQRCVLQNMDLTAKPGQVVALVGPSGRCVEITSSSTLLCCNPHAWLMPNIHFHFSGKSSVMSLIQHLYEPSAGDVLVDGHKVRLSNTCYAILASHSNPILLVAIKVHNLSPQWLSRNVSVVSQEPTLFARSIRRNIMYGLEGTEFEPSDEEIKEAARLANAASFIEVSNMTNDLCTCVVLLVFSHDEFFDISQNLPLGYETDVGERGGERTFF